MEPVYIVTSLHRSGSSMMMRCLEAGGLTPVHNPVAILLNQVLHDYIPNPNGFYQYGKPITKDFYENNKGKLVKVPISELKNLPEGNYKILLLKRDPKEIRASMLKWTPYQSWGMYLTSTFLYDELVSTINPTITINYSDIVNDPIQAFTTISEHFPIDIEAASNLVDPELYRLKLENDGSSRT